MKNEILRFIIGISLIIIGIVVMYDLILQFIRLILGIILFLIGFSLVSRRRGY